MKNTNKRKGISLIVLVITILVMIILAGVVVVSLQKNNPIEKAKDSKDMTNLTSMKEELELYKANELMLGNNPNNIFANINESDKILKSIPSNLKGKVSISNGKLGVYYSMLTEGGRKHARENDIFDAEDKILPDADLVIENSNGKKYIVVDSVDYENGISKIICKNTNEVKNITESNPKIGFVKLDSINALPEDNILISEIRSRYPNVEEVKPGTYDFSKYNVIVLNGGARWKYTYDKEIDKAVVNRVLQGTKENPVYVITSGNDSHTLEENHPLIVAENRIHETRPGINKKLVDNTVTRQIEKWIHDDSHETIPDTLVVCKFKNSPNTIRYYEDTNGTVSKDSIAMYIDREKGQGWFHMHFGSYLNLGNGQTVAGQRETYIAAISKMLGNNTMKIDVTNIPQGTVYTFDIIDLAGNTLTKTITI